MFGLSKIEWTEGIHLSIDALKTYRLRTVLTTLGIIIGVFVVTVIISVIQGLNHFVSSELSGLGTHTLYISKMPWIIRSTEELVKYRKRKDIRTVHYLALKEKATLALAVAPEYDHSQTVQYRNTSLENVYIIGTTEDYMYTANVFPSTGRFFNELEIKAHRNVCVIGWEVAEKLFKERSPLEAWIKIGSHPFRILGVMAKRGEFFGQSMDAMVFIPYTVFEKYYGTHRSLTITIKPEKPQCMDALIDQIRGILRQARRLGPEEEDDFSINQQSQLLQMYQQMTRILWIIMIAIGSISLLVGGINIMNILLVSVTDRTREIGIRKALGAKKRTILYQFLIESIFISGLGVVIGILLSVGATVLIRKWTPIPVHVSYSIGFLGMAFTLIVGIFFGLYPASKAAQLDPIVALRYE